MNFYDVLAAEKWGGGIPTINFFDLLFAQSMGGGKQWQTYEGTLPATLNANGDNLRQYQVWGSTGGVGDAIENLWNADTYANCYVNVYTGEFVNNDKTASGAIIPCVPNTTYTVTKFGSSNRFRICSYDAYPVNGAIGDALFNSDSADYATFTTPSDALYFVIYVDYSSMITSPPKTPPLTVFPSTAPMSVFAQTCCVVPIGVKSGNLLDFNALRDAPSGKIGNTTFQHLLVMILAPNTAYTLVSDGTGSTSKAGDVSRSIYVNTGEIQNCVFAEHPVQITTDTTGVIKIAFLIERTNAQQYINGTAHVWLVKGSDTLPYQPYFSTVIPIYIGDEPLEKDEYVNYTEQKIYRTVDGTLTPTDPPVPLSTLPTCEGETVVDYAGQSVAPEKVYFEYQGGKQS